jgi:hypothetical protein
MQATPFLLNPATPTDGFTQSELSVLANCPRKWYWQYNHRLLKNGSFSWPLLVGSVIHSSLEQMYRTRGTDWSCDDIVLPRGVVLNSDGEAKKMYWEALCRTMTRAYFHFYKAEWESLVYEPADVEVDAEFEFQGILLRAKLDLIFRSSAKSTGIWVRDHKTSGRIGPDAIAGWEFRFQFMFYAWMLWKIRPNDNVRGYEINAIKKPQLRIKKDESVETFCTRVYNDMLFDRPHEYFYRDRLILTRDALQHFEDDVLIHKIRRLKIIFGQNAPVELRQILAMDMNTDHCVNFGSVCPYLCLCKEGYEPNAYQFYQKAVKHSELDAEVDE